METRTTTSSCFERSAKPVAVSPNARLLDVALANDWEVIAAGDKRRALPH